ncbi:MAG: CDP-archaeol synthase [Candidatus Woesearchaeota archaeon]
MILKILWYMLPAYVANSMPIYAKAIFGKRFDTAVDFGKRWHGKPIFGSHKTFRGFVSGIAGAVVCVVLQAGLVAYPAISAINLVDYSKINLVWYGFLIGFGALLGDAVKSFFKRRVNIKPGASWKPWDWIDFVAGSVVLSSGVFMPSAKIIVGAFLITPFLAVAAVRIGYYLKLRDVEW